MENVTSSSQFNLRQLSIMLSKEIRGSWKPWRFGVVSNFSRISLCPRIVIQRLFHCLLSLVFIVHLELQSLGILFYFLHVARELQGSMQRLFAIHVHIQVNVQMLSIFFLGLSGRMR